MAYSAKTIPARKAITVTPSDVTEYAYCRGVYVGTGGDLALILREDETAVTFTNVQDGTLLPFDARLVMSTNTTATDIRIVL